MDFHLKIVTESAHTVTPCCSQQIFSNGQNFAYLGSTVVSKLVFYLYTEVYKNIKLNRGVIIVYERSSATI